MKHKTVIFLFLVIHSNLLFAQNNIKPSIGLIFHPQNKEQLYPNQDIIRNALINLKKCNSDELLFDEVILFNYIALWTLHINDIQDLFLSVDDTSRLIQLSKEESIIKLESIKMRNCDYLLIVDYIEYKNAPSIEYQFILYNNNNTNLKLVDIISHITVTLNSTELDDFKKNLFEFKFIQLFKESHCKPKVKINVINKVLFGDYYYCSTSDSFILKPELYNSPSSDINNTEFYWPILPYVNKLINHNKYLKGIINKPGIYEFGIIANDLVFQSDTTKIYINIIEPPVFLSTQFIKKNKVYLICHKSLFDEEPKYFKHDLIYIKFSYPPYNIKFKYALPEDQYSTIKKFKFKEEDSNSFLKRIFHIKEEIILDTLDKNYKINIGDGIDPNILGTYNLKIEAFDCGIFCDSQFVTVKHYKLAPFTIFGIFETCKMSNENKISPFSSTLTGLSNYGIGINYHYIKYFCTEFDLLYIHSYFTSSLGEWEIVDKQITWRIIEGIELLPNKRNINAGIYMGFLKCQIKHNIYPIQGNNGFLEYGIYIKYRMPNPSVITYLRYSYTPPVGNTYYSMNNISFGIGYNFMKKR